MAVPAHLFDEVARLPEADRRELAEYLAQLDEPEPEGAEREALLAALARSEADVQAGRTRPAAEMIAELRAMLK